MLKDETVAELDHLKNHNHEYMNNEINVDDSLESSLKSLHHKQKVRRRNKFGKNFNTEIKKNSI
jgi:hypothetical protein